MNPSAPWWKTGIIYQVYPRSFQDSNGDGIGDLQGIIQRLDYLAWLGIDAIWISPIMRSPMVDFGYDVSDYFDIDPLFGTLALFDQLVAEAALRNIKIVIDLVPNHTSDQHPWFVESRTSRENPRRDWYVWADAKADGSPPNNWLAYFGGGAWTWDTTTGQYYLHLFTPEQPDLNYRNPLVVEAMKGVIRFWLGRGVAGMRVDVIDRLLKDPELRDDPPDPSYVEGVSNPQFKNLRVNSEQHPDVYPLIRELRRTFDEFGDRPIIGEIAYTTDVAKMARAYDEMQGMQLPFNFAMLMLPWDAAVLRDFIDRYDAAVPPGGQPNYVFSNHDQPRIATRFGEAGARVVAMLLLTLRGTPTIYYGDELGMPEADIPPDQFRDPQGVNIGITRDGCRTPMQWDMTPNAGFTSATPWLPTSPDYLTRNVEAQSADPTSMLALYRRLIALRRATPALLYGTYRSLDTGVPDTLVYLRELGGMRYCVALNLSERMASLALRDLGSGRIVASTHMDRTEPIDMGALYLRENEGVVLDLGAMG
jgi:alpha-glucosidase